MTSLLKITEPIHLEQASQTDLILALNSVAKVAIMINLAIKPEM